MTELIQNPEISGETGWQHIVGTGNVTYSDPKTGDTTVTFSDGSIVTWLQIPISRCEVSRNYQYKIIVTEEPDDADYATIAVAGVVVYENAGVGTFEGMVRCEDPTNVDVALTCNVIGDWTLDYVSVIDQGRTPDPKDHFSPCDHPRPCKASRRMRS